MGNQLENVAVVACLKIFLFIFNIVFWLTGLVLLTLGLWAAFDLCKYMELSPEFSGTAPHALIGIAGLTVLVSSIAFSCIIKGQPVLLYIYGGFLACILMMNVGMGVSVSCYGDTFPRVLHDGLTQTLVTYDAHKANFDFAQSTFHCCGVANYTDWVKYSPQRVIPISCCIDPNHCITANYNDVYQLGCYEIIMKCINSNMALLTGIAVGAAMFPLVGIFISCFLASYIKKSKYDAIIN